MKMSKEELTVAAYEMTGGNLSTLTVDQIRRLMTVTQYVTDLCLNEIEERGELTFHGEYPIIPYHAEHGVETILTRT